MVRSPRDPGVPPDDVLRQLRVPLVRRARLRLEDGFEETLLLDVGLRGVFVEHRGALPVGTPAEVGFTLPGNEQEIRARCRVAWYHARGEPLVSKQLPEGLGLEFLEIAGDAARRLREHVIAHCRLEGKARRFHPRWPGAGGSAS